MSTQPIDYEALAQRAGAVSSTPPPVDYAALAKKAGAVSSINSPDSSADVPWYQKAASSVNNAVNNFSDTLIGTHTNEGVIKGFTEGLPYMAQHPIDSAALLGGALLHGHTDTANEAADQFKQPGVMNKVIGSGRYVQSGIPGAGPILDRAGKQINAGDYSGALGTTGGVGAMVFGGTEPVVNASTKLADMMKKAPAEVMKSPAKVATVVENLRPQGAQQAVVRSALNLPMKAVSGAEDIFRAAAPTGMNRSFRENLYVAAPDLADIGRKIDLAEAKGGIINPDMRVRATVEAISSHLDEMYQNERSPQIERNAAAPVSMHLGPDGVEGLQYMKRSAGEAETRAIAAKALEERTLTLGEANKLAMVANQNLKGFESMTAADRAQASMTNRRLGALKALDKSLGREMNDVLTSAGEEGLRSYERRFAALSEVRDQLSTRVNATELKQPGVIKSLIKPIGAAITGGPSGIASASQAAVADVNIGKLLQGGFRKLSGSGISAKPSGLTSLPAR